MHLLVRLSKYGKIAHPLTDPKAACTGGKGLLNRYSKQKTNPCLGG